MSFWDWWGSAEGKIALAGIAGSAVSVAMEWTGWGPSARKFLVGAAAAYFLSPVGMKFFHFIFGAMSIAEEQSASVGGFITGIGGVIIVEIILKAFRLRHAEIGRRRHDET
ncbi:MULTISPECIES: hypothetical protein [Rhizobium/Agrobacterium group]|uniref:Holin n=1 Tax=Agrobacterium tumefaciens TaxID=358 RepID=A0AAJ4T9Q8_AGRTU|nr:MULTISPECIES: hypothetical protein [Rhizobium/Agrobacterium group]MBS0258393.1 hypothetical protein [Pseudomonadota bacterium]NTA80727.1 hypothetical protein [Agrobacterium tumefaciens]OCJ67690.1 hypothetical protein A6U97_02925 [Agrobacterium tumefaciens]OMP69940.1 hypothetical protein BV900_22930 [Agrobacterium tumefaciens]PYG56642.1 hypothetical protein N434_03531 [Rhizobium sp. UGM030330-04]